MFAIEEWEGVGMRLMLKMGGKKAFKAGGKSKNKDYFRNKRVPNGATNIFDF